MGSHHRRRLAHSLHHHAVALGELERASSSAPRTRRCPGRSFRRISRKPTGASFATPSVPRKSRSPSAVSFASLKAMPRAVATALSVTPGAGDQRFEQHVARAGLQPAAAGGGMQARFDQRLAGVDAAGDALADSALRAQRDDCRRGILLVAFLDRRLQRLQLFGVMITERLRAPLADRLWMRPKPATKRASRGVIFQNEKSASSKLIACSGNRSSQRFSIRRSCP